MKHSFRYSLNKLSENEFDFYLEQSDTQQINAIVITINKYPAFSKNYDNEPLILDFYLENFSGQNLSNDFSSYSQEGKIGFIITKEEDLLNSFLSNDFIRRKFFIVPAKPRFPLKIRFKVNELKSDFVFPDKLFSFKEIVYPLNSLYINTLEYQAGTSLSEFYSPYNKNHCLNLMSKNFYLQGTVNLDDLLSESLMQDFVYFANNNAEERESFVFVSGKYKIVFSNSTYLIPKLSFSKHTMSFFEQQDNINIPTENYIYNLIKTILVYLINYKYFFSEDANFYIFLSKLANTLENISTNILRKSIDFSTHLFLGEQISDQEKTELYVLLYLLSELIKIKLFDDSRTSSNNFQALQNFMRVLSSLNVFKTFLSQKQKIKLQLNTNADKAFLFSVLLYVFLLAKKRIIRTNQILLGQTIYNINNTVLRKIDETIRVFSILPPYYDPNNNIKILQQIDITEYSKFLFASSIIWALESAEVKFNGQKMYDFEEQSVKFFEVFDNDFRRILFEYVYSDEELFVFTNISTTNRNEAIFNMNTVATKLYLLSKMINNKTRQNNYNLKVIVNVIK